MPRLVILNICKFTLLIVLINQIGVIIAKSLITNRNLKKMNLKGNIIKSEGGKAFRHCLFNSESCSLVALNLYQNPIGAGVEQDIDEILRGI